MEVSPQKLVEVAAMLPILHVPAGAITVAAVGPMADQMAAEALRWRDVRQVFIIGKTAINDGRVKPVDRLPVGSVDVLLLSAEQAPKPWLKALAPGGVISSITGLASKVRPLRAGLQHDLGNATPWRDWLPTPIYGVLAANGPTKVQRQRNPPAASKHLSRQYLPCLFTFAKDELPLFF